MQVLQEALPGGIVDQLQWLQARHVDPEHLRNKPLGPEAFKGRVPFRPRRSASSQ